MVKYYRGHIQQHAAFWVRFRELPHEEHFVAFIELFKQIKQEVDDGRCNLRDAGYALKPGCYDDDVYRPHEADMSFIQDAVEDLIILAGTNEEEAAKIWEYIVGMMRATIESYERTTTN